MADFPDSINIRKSGGGVEDGPRVGVEVGTVAGAEVVDGVGPGVDAGVPINRIKADVSEHILGVRLGLDKKESTKLAYRIQEATILVGHINQAPLSRFDAEIVYRERWMSSIKYCLPITRFTRAQCHKCTPIVEKEIIPELEFNENASKVFLYGPPRYGGKEIMYTHTEQIIMHT